MQGSVLTIGRQLIQLTSLLVIFLLFKMNFSSYVLRGVVPYPESRNSYTECCQLPMYLSKTFHLEILIQR